MRVVLFLIVALVSLSCQEEIDYQTKEYPYLILETVEGDAQLVELKARIPNYRPNWITEASFSWSAASGEKYTQQATISETGHMTALVTSDMKRYREYYIRAMVKTKDFTVHSSGLNYTSQLANKPKLTSITPPYVYDQDTVTVFGMHLTRNPKKLKIEVQGLAAHILSCSYDSIVFQMPYSSNVGAVDLWVQVDDEFISIDDALVINAPQISHISSHRAHSGDVIEVYGEHLIGNGTQYTLQCQQLNGSHPRTYEADVFDVSNEKISFIVPESRDLCEDLVMKLSYKNQYKTCSFSDSVVVEAYWSEMQSSSIDEIWRVYGFSHQGLGYVYHNGMHLYDPSTDTWIKVPNSKSPEHINERSKYIKQGDYFFIIGGYTFNEGNVRTVMAYHMNNNMWIKRNDIPFEFLRLAYVVKGDHVFVLTDRGEVWKCDFVNQKYTQMNMFQSSIKSVITEGFVANDQIYFLLNNTTYRYDEIADSWTAVCHDTFHMDGYYSSCAYSFMLNGTAYFIDKGETLYRFEVADQKWVRVVEFPYSNYPVYKSACFTIADKAYITVTGATYKHYSYVFQE